jgi:hypothetical protein
MTWQAFTIAAPPGINQLGSLLSTGLNLFTTALQALETELQVTQAAASDPGGISEQAANQAIQTAVLAIKDLIDQILLATGCYVLVIPIPKKALINPQTTTDDSNRNQVNPSYFPIGPILSQLGSGDTSPLYSQLDFASLFNPNATNVGGNAWLIKTLTESLYDSGDLQRPRWPTSMYWASCQIVVGAIDYTQVASMMLYMDNLFSGATSRGQNMQRSQTVLVPQSVTASVAYPQTTATPAVIVSWPALDSGRILSAFDSATVTAVRMAIIRSTDFRARSALRVSDLFSSTLSTGTTGQYGATVLFEGPFDGITNRYVDSSSLVDGTDYFYHVAFQTQLNVAGAAPVINDYSTLSAVVPVHYSTQAQIPLTPSKPPDWQRTPSIVQLIPPLANFLTQIKVYLDGFAAGAQSYTDHQTAYTQFLNQQIAIYEAKAASVVTVVQQLAALFSVPSAGGAYVRFSTGEGAVASVAADFIQSLTDTSDQNRPPFDQGTEYTAAIIFLAAGPDPTSAAASLGFLQTLLGSTSLTPVQTALAQITQAVAAAEVITINQLTATPSSTFDAAGNPLPPGTPDPTCAT